MKIIEKTSFKGKQNRITVTHADTIAEAINVIQALAILAISEIATETLEVIQRHKVSICKGYACIHYPNGDTLEYSIEQ